LPGKRAPNLSIIPRSERRAGSEAKVVAAKTSASAALAAVVLAAATPAGRASPAGPEEEFERDGFMLSVAIGPGAYFGSGDLGILDGGGGMFSLRFGTRATANMQWLLELDSGAFADDVGGLSDINNVHTLQLLGLQWYMREVVWFRYGIGRAAFNQRKNRMEELEDGIALVGLGQMVSLGYDVFRRGSFAFDIELTVTSALYKDATMAHAGFAVAANWY
jgi:hypothetical protein